MFSVLALSDKPEPGESHIPLFVDAVGTREPVAFTIGAAAGEIGITQQAQHGIGLEILVLIGNLPEGFTLEYKDNNPKIRHQHLVDQSVKYSVIPN